MKYEYIIGEIFQQKPKKLLRRIICQSRINRYILFKILMNRTVIDMKILIISPRTTHKTLSGSQKCIFDYCELLKSQGYELFYYYIGNRHSSIDDVNLTKDYFGESHFFYYKPTFIELTFFSIINRYRQIFFSNYFKVDDKYPFNLSKSVNKIINKENIHAVIINYITYTKLFNHLKGNIKKIVFTHDTFTFRKKHSNLPVWSMLPNEEAKGLNRCDYILAIQNNDAIFFNYLAPNSHCIPIYSTFKFKLQEIVETNDILFLSSDNEFNRVAIIDFIENVFIEIRKMDTSVSLIIGGKICDFLHSKLLPTGIKLCGIVDNAESFYKLSDIVINPTFSGTGLKIKTFEAISYGKVVIAHKHSSEGIFRKEKAPLYIYESPEEAIMLLKEVLAYKISRKENQLACEDYIRMLNNYVSSTYDEILK